MLRFFKVNDPYRPLFLLAFLLLLRVPFYWNGIETLLPDLHYMLIGERLANGNALYKDLWVNIGPFSAAFFTILDWLFGKSIISYHIIGFLLMFIQAMLFNRLALKNKIYTENNYVPAAVYVTLMSMSMDMFVVSPIMLANTFILMAMNHIFSQVEFRTKRDEKILSIGIYLGVASLFYFPAVLFGLIGILGLTLFSATILRRYLLIVYGLTLPFLMIAVYYFLMGNTTDSMFVFFNSWFEVADYRLDRTAIIILCAVPTMFLMLAIFRVLQGTRFSNYQARIAQMMLFWILLSLPLLIKPLSGVSDLIVFVPPTAYFITHFFILSRKRIFSGALFFIFVSSVISLSYATYFDYWGISKYINYDSLVVKKSRYDNLLRGQKIWVIGNDLQLYKNSTLASKYYAWETYKDQFLQGINRPDQIALVYKDLVDNTPDIIIDQHEIIPQYFSAMPKVSQQYEELEKGIYIRTGFELQKHH